MHWSMQKNRHISRSPCHISYVTKRTELHASPGDERGRGGGGGGGQSFVQHNHVRSIVRGEEAVLDLGRCFPPVFSFFV